MGFRNRAITKEIQQNLTPNDVLQGFIEGNNRFINDEIHSIDHKALIYQTTTGQFPKAIVLSCIDSRVPVELLFDQAIGDIFVARVAGNFENIDILGSMEYSCKIAGSKLIFVLGHQNCGAIKAACDCVELGNITAMLSNITPAIRLTLKKTNTIITNSSNKDFVKETTYNNVILTIKRIRQKSPILREMEKKKEIKIVGGVYNLSTGKVEIIT